MLPKELVIKICEKCFLCHSIVLCLTCRNVKNAALNLPVGARLQNFWTVWSQMGAGPKVVQILKQGYTLPFQNRPKLSRVPTVVSSYANLHRNSYLLEALQQLSDKNAVERVHNQTSLGFFNRLFLVPKPNNKWRPILDLSKLNLFLKTEKFRMETPETIRTSLQRGEWVTSGTIQEISQVSCPRSDIPIQGSSLWPVHSSHGVHSGSQGGEVDGRSQGYKNPPVPRRLVGKGQIPLNLLAKHTNPSQNMSETRLVSELRKVGTGAKTSLQLCRLPVRLQIRPGQTDPGPVAKPPGQNKITTASTGLSGPAVHVLNRLTNGHRETSSSRPTTHETHTVASQKQLDSTGILGEDHPSTQIPTPTLTMVAKRKQCASRSTITPHKACSANVYRRIKRRLGRSFKRAHCKGVLVSSGKQTAHKLLGTESSLFGFKRVPRPLHRQNSPSGHRQYNSGGLHKQRRRHDVGPTVCPTMENLDLVFPKTSDSKSPTYPRPSKCDSRQAVQAGSDHPNRVVPPSGSFSTIMQSMAPASNRPICHEIQPQTTSVCLSSTGLPGRSSGCTYPAMGRSGCIRLPTDCHIGQSGGETTGLPVQETHSDCPGLAQHALVLGLSDHVQSGPSQPAQPAQAANTDLQSDPSQKSDKPKSPCLAPRASKIKEQGFSEAVAARIEAPQRGSTRSVYEAK